MATQSVRPTWFLISIVHITTIFTAAFALSAGLALILRSDMQILISPQWSPLVLVILIAMAMFIYFGGISQLIASSLARRIGGNPNGTPRWIGLLIKSAQNDES